MVTNLKAILDIGEAGGFAIPAFNVYNLESVVGVTRAAEATGAPIILQMYSRLFDTGHADYLAPVVHEAIRRLSVPAVFHLDHGAGIPQALRALRLGATGVMIDASTLPLEQNIARTREVVQMCAECGVSVEGELGHVGGTADAHMDEFTRVDEAAVYARETGVSALAILVGTAHGRYKKAPVLDTERIRDVREATGLPIVLHGGSGVPDDQVRAAVSAGVRKVNFGTDICCAFLDAVFAKVGTVAALDTFMKEPIAAVQEYAIGRIRLLGADRYAASVFGSIRPETSPAEKP